MILIVDCGATKTDWCVVNGKDVRTVRTPGFNLLQTPQETLFTIFDQAAESIGSGIERIHFYAAALLGKPSFDLNNWFPDAEIEYASDMLGAARSVCGHAPGVAAILGTGANTCSFDGKKIGWKVDCGGFILGDEGSASVLAKLFISDYIKNMLPQALATEFNERYQLDYATLVKRVYATEAPARFLGTFAPFILSHYQQSEYVRDLVDYNFRGLFERTLSQYDPSLPVGVVGGFGYACKDILERLGQEYGVKFSAFEATPAEGLIRYHAV